MKLTIFSFLVICCSVCAFGQEWATAYENSVTYYNNYQSEEAKTSALKAYELITGESEEPTKNLSVILRQLAIVSYDLGEDEEAAKYAQEEIRTLKLIGENKDLNYAMALQNLALIRIFRSEYGAAEKLLEEAIPLAMEFQTSDSYGIASLNGQLAIAKFHLKKDEEATQLFESAIETLHQYDEVTDDYYQIIYNYSTLLAESGAHQEALPFLLEMEDYYAYDAPNETYGSILIQVGSEYDALGEYEKALEKYQQAIENFETINGQSLSDYTIALNNEALALQKTGQFDRATEELEKLIGNLDNADNHTKASVLTNYANLLIRKGNFVKSKSVLDQVKQLYSGKSPDKVFVNALESESIVELHLGHIDESSDAIEKAIKIAETESMSALMYMLHAQKAKVLTRKGSYQEADAVASQALEEAVERFGEASPKTASIKETLAGIKAQLGQYGEAQKLFEELLPLYHQQYGERHPEYATLAANFSSLLQLEGKYYSAEFYLKIAEDIKREAFGKDNEDYLTTYENLALLYQNTARYTEASSILEEILAIKQNASEENPASLAYTLANLGNIKRQLADYSEAERLLKDARSIYASSVGREHLHYANVTNNMALLYLKMGNLEAARPLFEEAMATYEKSLGKISPEYATALENLATLYEMNDELDQAKTLLEEAVKIDEQVLGKEHPLYSKSLHNLASILEEQGNYERAEQLYQEALAIDRKVYGENHPSYASTLYNLAVLEQELENYDKAKEYYQQALTIRKNILGENHPDYAYALYGLASIKHKTGDFEGARVDYEIVTNKYLDNIQKYFPALSESEKSAFYARIKPVFDAYMDYAVEYCLLQKGDENTRAQLKGQMYNLQLNTKALLLNASNKVRNTILASGDQDLISLFNEWQTLKENIVKAYSLSKEELDNSKVSISALEAEANELEKQLSLKSSAFATTFEQKAPEWTDVKNQLQSDEAAIEVIRIKKKMKTDSVLYVALMISSTSPAPAITVNANGVELEEKGFKKYKNSIIYKIPDSQSYDAFWKNIHEKLPDNVNTIYLSADGVLNKVNVATLLDPESKEYMVDRYKIRLLSNTRELLNSKESNNPTNQAILFGFPAFDLGTLPNREQGALFSEADMKTSFGQNIAALPGTKVEVESIDEILNGGSWNSESYLARLATEETIKSISSPKILHIATHGFFLEDLKMDKEEAGIDSRSAKFNPLLRSGLLLAGAQNTVRQQQIPGEEDGILTAYEAMNLPLDQTDLVVMSACETGLGEVKNGEGVYGLQRSFMVAGANNLIMSLWKVNDATTQLLMSSFYKNWFGGQESLEAFNNAILEVRNQFKEPYYWGAFVMLGN